MRSRQACVLLLLAALLWGSGNVANKTILADVSPVGAVFLRSVIAALALLWPVRREAMRATDAGIRASGWLRSVAPGCVMFALALLIQQWGYQTATVTNASFLVNACCVLTPVLGVLFWRDRLQARTAVSAGLVLVGALLMSGAGRSLAMMNPGDALCLLSALFYAFWIILIGRHLEMFATPAATVLAQCLCTAALSAPFALTAGGGRAQDWWGAMPEALYLGLFSTAAAFLLTAAAQTRVSATTTAIIVSAESLFGGAAGMLVLSERPEPAALAGAGLILLGIVIMALRPEPVGLCAPNRTDIGPAGSGQGL